MAASLFAPRLNARFGSIAELSSARADQCPLLRNERGRQLRRIVKAASYLLTASLTASLKPPTAF